MKKRIPILLFFVFMTQIIIAQDALSFDAVSSERVRLDDNATTDQMEGATNYTIEAWVKPTSTDIHNKVIMKLWDKFAVTMYKNDERRLYFTHYDGANDYVNTKKNVLTINAWNHIAVICNSAANTIKIYVNGVDVTEDTETAADVVLGGVESGDNFYVAYGGAGTYADIDVREVRVKFVAESIASLNTTDVTNTYVTDANTAILLHFTDGSGATTANTAGGAAANLNNTPTWITTDTNTWTGGFDTSWVDGSNWSAGGPPTATTDVIVPDLTNQPITGSNVTFKTMSIRSGASATITGTVTNTGAITIDSGGSLIASNTVSGDLTYKRNLPTANWYLISSPVTGETIEDYLTNNVIDNTGVGTNVGLAPYVNDGTAWDYFEDGETGALTSAKGYSTKLLSGSGNIVFTGAMPVADVSIAITDGATNELNLIGNPYPSYIPLNSAADAVNNILKINGSTGTNQLSEDTIWLWDESVSGYVTINLGDTSRFIAPGQGFFVDSKVGGGTFSFTEAMQSHQATDVFSRTTNNRFEVTLSISDGSNTKSTNLRYIEGKTTSFDNGYDSSMFGGVSNSFAVYTQTITNNQGKNLAIQSLPNKEYSDMVIPVGINAVSGAEITFSAEAINLPTDILVFLEDRDTNTFARLDEANSEYKVTLSANSNGVGRFYIHTTTQAALGIDSVVLENVSIYKTTNNTLRIVGLQQGKSSVSLFSIQGKKVMSKSFTSNGVSNVFLPKLATGIYIIKLQTENGKLTKKIIIE